MNDNITSNVQKFADDMKVFRKIKHYGDQHQIQNDLDTLANKSEKWQMLLYFWKCKCLYTEHRNLNLNYKVVLSTIVKESYLGAKISANMKESEQCGSTRSHRGQ